MSWVLGIKGWKIRLTDKSVESPLQNCLRPLVFLITGVFLYRPFDHDAHNRTNIQTQRMRLGSSSNWLNCSNLYLLFTHTRQFKPTNRFGIPTKPVQEPKLGSSLGVFPELTRRNGGSSNVLDPDEGFSRSRLGAAPTLAAKTLRKGTPPHNLFFKKRDIGSENSRGFLAMQGMLNDAQR